MEKVLQIGPYRLWRGGPFFLIAGPCVIEDKETTFKVARHLKSICDDLEIPLIFKSSYDKANRTSIRSFRGPGIEKGLEILAQIRQELEIPILSDVHQVQEVEIAARVLDVIQIPAFLCRQTDLVVAAASAHKPINLKKGQFLSPWEMEQAVTKATSTGNHQVILTERGSCFGYNNLVVDMRSIEIMGLLGFPVVFDATHSVQLPGGSGTKSGGQREFVPCLARAAVAAGADGIFMEVHPDPPTALCDGPNSVPLADVEPLVAIFKKIHRVVRNTLPHPERHIER